MSCFWFGAFIVRESQFTTAKSFIEALKETFRGGLEIMDF